MLDQKDRESREALVEHWANLAFLSFRYSQGNAGLSEYNQMFRDVIDL